MPVEFVPGAVRIRCAGQLARANDIKYRKTQRHTLIQTNEVSSNEFHSFKQNNFPNDWKDFPSTYDEGFFLLRAWPCSLSLLDSLFLDVIPSKTVSVFEYFVFVDPSPSLL